MREKILLEDTTKDVLIKMAEGNPGAITAMIGLIQKQGEGEGLMTLLVLDDMNMRGTQIWIAYKDFANQKMDVFIEAIRKRDPLMIDKVNQVGKMGNHTEIAVTSKCAPVSE